MQVAFLSCTKGHSFQVMTEEQRWKKEVTLALAPSAGQGGRPRGILPADGPASRAVDRTLGTGSTHLPTLKASICLPILSGVRAWGAAPSGKTPFLPRVLPLWDSPSASHGPREWTFLGSSLIV